MKKRRVKKVIVHKHPPKTVMEKRVDDLEAKLTSLQEIIQKVGIACATEIGSIKAQMEVFADSVDHLDNNVLCSTYIMKDMVIHLAKIDEILSILDSGSSVTSNLDLDDIRDKALAWFKATVSIGFKQVAAQKAEHRANKIKEREAKEKEAAEAAKQASTHKQEETNAASALKEAETQDIADTTTAGPGSGFPEGAEIFGGS